jgi:tetratricopeptide (TPR) repeat protein
VHERTARYRAALSCYTRGRDLVVGSGADRDEAVERCEHAIAYAGVRYRQGKHSECLRWAEVAVDEASRIAYQPGLAHALYLQDIAMSCLGRPSQTIAERSLSIYEELGDLIGQGNALNNMGVEAYFRGRWPESLDLYERSAKVREQAGDVTGAATEQNNIAEILSDQGHLPRARELFGAAREVWIAAGYKVGVALAVSNLGRLAGRAGDFDLGARLLTDARARFESIGSVVHQLEADGRLIELSLIEGRIDDAHEAAERLVSAVESGGGADALETVAYRLLGIACARRGDLEGGLAQLKRSTVRAEQQDEAFELALGVAAHATLLHRVRATQVRDDIDTSCRRALEIFESLGVIDVPVTSMNDRWPAMGQEILAGLG